MLYPLIGDPKDGGRTLNPAVAQIGTEHFVLEFDDLSLKNEQFHAQFIPCNAEWQQSDISDIEILGEYNDFIINDYQVSQGTKVPFYHYRLELPLLKIAGNYLLIVYRERNKKDLILSKRCMVYQNRIGCLATVNFAQDPAKRKTHQQIDLEISYGGYPIISPRDELKIVIRQNYRWDKTIKNLKPTSVDEIQQKLEYRFFDNENVFVAGNEFRYFDARSTYSRGMYIDHFERGKEDEVFVSPAHDRSDLAYIEMTDFNGLYIIDNADTFDDNTGADYNLVHFALKSPELEGEKKVFVNASFNNWQLNKANLMEYNNDFGGYLGTFELKQGIYNYDFVVQDEATKKLDEEYFEGNFSDSENAYEVIIYHKPFGSRAEQIVGYRLVEFNKKR